MVVELLGALFFLISLGALGAIMLVLMWTTK